MHTPVLSILLASLFLSTPATSMDADEKPVISQLSERGKLTWSLFHLRKKEEMVYSSHKSQKVVSQKEDDCNSVIKKHEEQNYLVEHKRISHFIEEINPNGSSFNLDCRKVFSLPNTTHIMKKLSYCKYIDLSFNDISALPDEIEEWSSLLSLDLADNKFSIVPWQLFTIGTNVNRLETISINLCNNPITRIPIEFYETMMNQEGKRKEYQGFTIVMNQEHILSFIVSEALKYPKLKSFLINSCLSHITNGFCTFQNQEGKYLGFDENSNPSFDFRRG